MNGLVEWGTVSFLFLMANICGFCKGSVYKVGDSAGWTIIGNLDYKKWASSKTFHVGDTLIFAYDRRYHNVLQVSRSDFHRCDSAAPIAAYATGNDSIVIRSSGHYYYICGFVGHCHAGQKVDIRVPNLHRRAAATLTPSPCPSPNEPAAPKATPAEPLAPSPSHSRGDSILRRDRFFSYRVGLSLALVWVVN